MRIAIIGAGFSGLACAYFLSKHRYTIEIFDANGIGGQASGIASGLLHPFAGAHAKLNKDGFIAMNASIALINASSLALNEPVANFSGILRPAVTETQKKDFLQASKLFPEQIEFWKEQKCHSYIPYLTPFPSIFIKSGITVYAKKYLKGLFLASNATLHQMKIESLDEIKRHFDHIIVACGIHTTQFKELAFLHLTPIKGQILILKWPKKVYPLPFPINSKKYLLMEPNNNTCLAGATFERKFTSSKPDIEEAKKHILPSIYHLLPILKQTKIIEAKAGIRASAKDHLPKIGHIDNHLWYITAMGSKGLLYHALYAKRLCKKLHQYNLNSPF